MLADLSVHVTEPRNVLPAGLFDEGDAAAAVPNVALDEVDSKAHQAVALATARQVAPRWDAMISAAMNQQLTSSPHRCLSKVLPYAQMQSPPLPSCNDDGNDDIGCRQGVILLQNGGAAGVAKLPLSPAVHKTVAMANAQRPFSQQAACIGGVCSGCCET